MPEVLSPHALCSDQDVLDWVGESSPSSREAQLAIRLANEASVKITNLAGREFNPDPETAGLRTFSGLELLRVECEDAVLEIGDAQTITGVVLKHDDGSTLPLVAGNHYITLPRRRMYAWEPLEALQIRRDRLTVAGRDVIEVTAEWGFPAVPEDIRGEAIKAAGLWFEREIRRHGENFEGEEPTQAATPEASRSLPRSAFETAIRYRRLRYG